MFGLNSDKLSVKCQLCTKRMNLVRNKKRMQVRWTRIGIPLISILFIFQKYLLILIRYLQIQALKAEVADMMNTKQEVNARIRVEEVIRQEWLVSVYATLETYLLLLQTRAGMLKKAKEPPPDMIEAINTIFFAAERVKYELDEMPAIAEMLMSKFRSALSQQYNTKDFPAMIVEENTALNMQVSPTVVAGLSVFPAKGAEKLAKLEQIAKEFNVPFNREEMERALIPVNPRMPPKVSATPYTNNNVGQTGQPAFTYVAQPAPARPPVEAVPVPPIPVSKPLPAGAFGPRIENPFEDIPPAGPAASGPPTRPTGVARVPSKTDPWAPLPPQKTNLGYDFDDRLDNVAQYMAGKRTSSADASSLASGGGSQDFNVSGRAGSVTSNLNPQHAAQQAQQGQEQKGIIQETDEAIDLLPQVPHTSAVPAAAEPLAPAPEEDDLLIRLARLKGL